MKNQKCEKMRSENSRFETENGSGRDPKKSKNEDPKIRDLKPKSAVWGIRKK